MRWVMAGLAVILCPVVIVVLVMLAPQQGSQRCAPVTAGIGAAKVQPMKAGTYTRTSGYGPREGGFHRGLDWAAEPDTPIYAAASGVVAEAGPASGFGMWIILDHNGPEGAYSTVYGHMFTDGVLVAAGESVTAGQPIARVGYNGQTVPAGPSGAHLHFELITGGPRLGGGTAVDPEPWLSDAAEPGSTPPPRTPGPDAEPRTPDIGVATPEPAGSGHPAGEAAPLPPEKGSENGLHTDAIRLVRVLAARYPQVPRFGGWRPPAPDDPVSDHADGRAIDVMIPDYTSGDGKALGDAVTDYVMAHAAELAVQYTIWRGIYRDNNGATQQQTSHDDDTADHFDHVHITVTGTGPAAEPGSAAGSTAPGCEAATARSGEDDLAAGSVPAEYERWYRQAGSLCPQIKASLLAAQGKQESGFDPRAQSSAGALGIAQFLPGTAAAANPDDGQPYVIDADGNGTASVWEPADAIIGQGRYMCALARKIDGWIADGSVTTSNPLELYLAAYNAGEGAVLRSGGFPTGHSDYQTQTRPYVETILAQADRYSTVLS